MVTAPYFLSCVQDIELSSNCLTATKATSSLPSTVRGTILYTGTGVHEFHAILDCLGPDGVWVGVAAPDMDPSSTVGDVGCGWALRSDGDKRSDGREEEFTQVGAALNRSQAFHHATFSAVGQQRSLNLARPGSSPRVSSELVRSHRSLSLKQAVGFWFV